MRETGGGKMRQTGSERPSSSNTLPTGVQRWTWLRDWGENAKKKPAKDQRKKEKREAKAFILLDYFLRLR